MKDVDASQSIARPVNVPIVIEPSADELMTDWLLERVTRAIELVIREAPNRNVRILTIHVFGFESYEEPTRMI
jgi:hypothetical protein